jgi:hypothetical protein
MQFSGLMAVPATAQLRTYVFTRQRSWPPSGSELQYSEDYDCFAELCTEALRDGCERIFRIKRFKAARKYEFMFRAHPATPPHTRCSRRLLAARHRRGRALCEQL